MLLPAFLEIQRRSFGFAAGITILDLCNTGSTQLHEHGFQVDVMEQVLK